MHSLALRVDQHPLGSGLTRKNTSWKELLRPDPGPSTLFAVSPLSESKRSVYIPQSHKEKENLRCNIANGSANVNDESSQTSQYLSFLSNSFLPLRILQHVI